MQIYDETLLEVVSRLAEITYEIWMELLLPFLDKNNDSGREYLIEYQVINIVEKHSNAKVS